MQGIFEGQERLQQLMLRTQSYLDKSAVLGNLNIDPAVTGVGGVVAGKQLDSLQQATDKKFTKFSFSGGGGGYTYKTKILSNLNTRITFSFDKLSRLGFGGYGQGGIGFWMESQDEYIVYHIEKVILPQAQKLLDAENAKAKPDSDAVDKLTQALDGWKRVLEVYDDMTAEALADESDSALPVYQPGQQEVNGMVQGALEGLWHQSLESHPYRNKMAFDGRDIPRSDLAKKPAFKQSYLDKSAVLGNLNIDPAVTGVGGVVAGKQLDSLQQATDKKFTKFSFSGGGGGYTYKTKILSNLNTRITFSFDKLSRLGFGGYGQGGIGFWMESQDEYM
ncbi:hypothetical protein PLESTF_000496300 [Pleodorina starrii]|nr:hypothetical protein PLESTF_000496300 [Pleodorina starrii]